MKPLTPAYGSRYTAIFIAVVLFVTQFYYNSTFYFHHGNLFSWDTFGYYIYLPFTFIYHDTGLQRHDIIDHLFKIYEPSTAFYQAIELPGHKMIPAYSIGMSLLYLPFFLIAHAWALLSSYPADGFSFPYQFCIGNGIMFYIIAGIYFLRKVLLEYFNDRITAITLIIICLGTNYFQETIHDSLVTHACLFALYALLMYVYIHWLRVPSAKLSVLLGAVCSLIVEIRASEIILVVLLLFWNVSNSTTWKARLTFYRENLFKVLVALLSAIIVFLPQVVHWKMVSGEWYFNNYQVAEGFNFTRPHLTEIFFSFKKSLFVYTPVLVYAIAGLIVMRRKMPGLFYPLSLFLAVNTYILSCWLLWWNATSFGLRYFVQSYALVSIPMGMCVSAVMDLRKLWRIIFYITVLFFVFLNIFQTWQAHHNILNRERTTAAYYKAVFLKTSIPAGADQLLEPDPGKPFSPANDVYTKTIINNGSVAVQLLNKDHPFLEIMRLPFDSVTHKPFAWLHISFQYRCDTVLSANPVSLVCHAVLDGTGRDKDKYETADLEKVMSKAGQWNSFEFNYRTPVRFYDSETLLVYLWLRGDHKVEFSHIKVDCLEPR